jgi:hypothetical protein
MMPWTRSGSFSKSARCLPSPCGTLSTTRNGGATDTFKQENRSTIITFKK